MMHFLTHNSVKSIFFSLTFLFENNNLFDFYLCQNSKFLTNNILIICISNGISYNFGHPVY